MVMHLPDREHAFIPPAKLSNYLLSLSHPAGRSQARFLLAVGYRMSPGENLKIYRENHGLTQGQLGELLDCVPRQHISNMERGVRSISTKTARKLAQLFTVSPGKFI